MGRVCVCGGDMMVKCLHFKVEHVKEANDHHKCKSFLLHSKRIVADTKVSKTRINTPTFLTAKWEHDTKF